MEKIAVITLTKQGIGLGEILRRGIPTADLYIPEKYEGIAGERIRAFDGNMRDLLAWIFREYAGFVFIMATGIVVRVIADYIRDKKFDPAVVVMDIMGKFSISLVSGHLGGANELARRVAELTGALPVITTGTDVNETIAPDLIAKEIGGEVDDFEVMKKVSAALVDSEKVGVVNLAGVEVKGLTQRLKENVRLFASLEELRSSDCRAGIVISHTLFTPEDLLPGRPCVLIRPKDLVVGIGCNRGTSAEEIEAVTRETLLKGKLSFKSVRNLATVEAKGDETGLLRFVEKVGLRLELYSRDEINNLAAELTPSEAMKHLGVRGVAEPAAILSAKGGTLLIPKQKSGNVTVAVALVNHG